MARALLIFALHCTQAVAIPAMAPGARVACRSTGQRRPAETFVIAPSERDTATLRTPFSFLELT